MCKKINKKTESELRFAVEVHFQSNIVSGNNFIEYANLNAGRELLVEENFSNNVKTLK